jgi:uncharacterized protein (TIGR03437 family)
MRTTRLSAIALLLFAAFPAFAGKAVASYNFEEGKAGSAVTGQNSVLDSSGGNHHGSPAGTPVPTYVSVNRAPSTLALQFTSTGSGRVMVPDSAAFELGSFNVRGSFSNAGQPSGGGVIIQRGDSRIAWRLRVALDQLFFSIVSPDGDAASVTTAPLAQNRFYTFVASFNGETGEMFLVIDGQFVQSMTTTLRPLLKLDPTKNPALSIGATPAGTTTYNGLIDDITVSEGPADLPPIISTNGVVNGASNLSGIASGAWVSIYGQNLSPMVNARIWDGSDFVNGKLPKSLAGVSATVNGRAAYIYFVSQNQINVLAPDDTAIGPVSVVVTTSAGSASATAMLQKFAPSFFMLPGSSFPAAIHIDGTLIGPPGLIDGVTTKPARPSEIVSIYGTGFGPTTPPLPADSLVTVPAELSSKPSVTLGGQPCEVQYAGMTGSGLVQLNVVIPANAPDGNLALAAMIGGVSVQPGVVLTVKSTP